MKHKVLDLFKHYKFVIGRVYLRLFEKFKNLNMKIWQLKTNIWNSKWLQIKNALLQNVDLIDQYKFDIDHVNIQGVLEILNFNNFKHIFGH
jgi:hypothetical protein